CRKHPVTGATEAESHAALTCGCDRPPQRHRLGAGRLGIPKQRLELMGIQPEGRWFRLGWPPGKAPGGKAFLAQPKTLAIENEALQRLAPPTRKNHQSTRHRNDLEMLPAHMRQAVYPLAEIHRLDRQPNPHLRGNLDHAPDLQNASAKPTRSSPSLPSQRIVILAPSPRANSTVQFGPSTGCATRGSSTNPGGGLARLFHDVRQEGAARALISEENSHFRWGGMPTTVCRSQL